MFTWSHMKGIASLGSAAIAIMLLSSCSGAGFGPTESRGTTPDLVVAAPLVSDSGPVAGLQFTMWTTVRNVGGGAAAATRLRYYRSPDATISTADTEVGTGAVTGLADSNSTRESVDLTAPSAAGTYYYGACVDAVTGESDTTNNCSSSVRVTVREPEPGEPDLMVAAPSVSDSGPTVGATFTLSATIRNDGEGTSAATTLRFYQSTDATITTSDTEAGSTAVATLAGSGSTNESVDVTAPATAGTYYYGACVDAVADESDTTNNCSASEQVAVSEADLVVATPTVSDSVPAAGATFTLSVRVESDGDGSAATTTLNIYRSTDATITTSDTLVGMVVAELATSETSSQSTRLAASTSPGAYYVGEVELTAPDTPGTYYYGACVDAVTEESDTTNNCSSSVEVNVVDSSAAQGKPDLMVRSPSVSDTRPATGERFTLSATVRNDGDGASVTTTLRYYRSTDATMTSSDTEVGTNVVAGLAASGTSSQSLELSAPATPGTYYFGACVDAVVDELDTNNNCSTSVEVAVPVPERPDLMVTAPSVTDSAPAAGATFTLSATVRNDGEGGSEAATLRYYRSMDATITTSDTEVGTAAVAELAASGSASESVALTAPSTPGTYYYGACVDTVTEESDTTNNCSASVQVMVPEPELHPDLAVASISASDGAPVVGATFTLSATVRNDGKGGSERTTLRYYQSRDARITTSDTEVSTDAVAELAALGSASGSVELTAPANAGTYYFGVCVDAVTDESDTTNNCSTSIQVTVQATVTEPQGHPDLMVGTPSVSDNGPAAGASFTLSVTVRNDGEGSSEATTLRYYRSTDAIITTSDMEASTNSVTGLGAAGSSSQSVDLTAPSSPGRYYYGACVDAVTDESDTANNCSASVQVTVPEPKYPDLMVGTPSVSDNGPAAGTSFTLSATVRNDGEGSSAATTLRYYRSTDATITTSDTEVGTDAVTGLAAAGSSDQSVDLTAPDTSGTYYYGACVDAVTDESDTTNNCSGSVKVAILQPDLVVGAPSVSTRYPEAGERFTLWVTVENNGEGEWDATTLRYYYSTDTAITRSDTEVDTDALVNFFNPLFIIGGSVVLTAPSTPGTYYYGACVDAVTDESDTTNNCSASVQVTVPQPKPDLVVGSPSVNESSPAGGAPFELTATVENHGEGSASTTTLRYYQSAYATISTSDTEVGADAIGGLAASGTSSQSVDLTAPSGPGTYYYGACVDAVTDESDTTNNCSTSVVVTVPGAEQQRASRIEISPGSLSFDTVDEFQTLRATVYDQNNYVMQRTFAFWVWSSADVEVARTNLFGSRFGSLQTSVQSIGEGTTTVTLSAGGSAVVGTASVTVTLPTARVTVSPASLTFEALGDTKKVTVTVVDENGDKDEGAKFSAFSIFSGGGIATKRVDDGLEITAEGRGSGKITVSSPGKASAIIFVTVYQNAATVTVSPDSVNLQVDGTATLRASAMDANGHDVRVAGSGNGGVVVHWETSDSEVATVDGAGDLAGSNTGATATVTAVAAGMATITGRLGGSAITGTATITVTESN